jgi:hypothetical protein
MRLVVTLAWLLLAGLTACTANGPGYMYGAGGGGFNSGGSARLQQHP